MSSEAKQKIEWEAFRYVAGEMNSEECAGFERLLDESQMAREAVADMVEVSQAVKLSLESEPVVAVTKRRPSGAGSWWLGVAMGSAACLLIMVSWQQTNTPNREAATETPDAEMPDAGALAARWSEVLQREDGGWNEDSIDDQFAESLSDWDADAALEEEPQTAPEWMMAAVSAAQKHQTMGDDMDMERSVDGPIEQ